MNFSSNSTREKTTTNISAARGVKEAVNYEGKNMINYLLSFETYTRRMSASRSFSQPINAAKSWDVPPQAAQHFSLDTLLMSWALEGGKDGKKERRLKSFLIYDLDNDSHPADVGFAKETREEKGKLFEGKNHKVKTRRIMEWMGAGCEEKKLSRKQSEVKHHLVGEFIITIRRMEQKEL